METKILKGKFPFLLKKKFESVIKPKKLIPVISWILLLSFLHLTVGCNYYKVKSVPAKTIEIKNVQQDEKYIIIRQGENAWHLKNLSVNEEKQEISGKKEDLPEYHKSYLKTKNPGSNRYRISEGKHLLNEVHMFVSEYEEGETGNIIIPFSRINRLDIYDKDKGGTVASHVAVIGGLSLLGLIIVASLTTKPDPSQQQTYSSCPFLYISDGTSYQLAGELFPGTIYSSLERDDYLPLPGLTSVNGEYQLKIANELLERQYINMAELIIVNTPHHSQALIDKKGQIQTVLKPESPSTALSDNNVDYAEAVQKKDITSYLFNEEHENPEKLSSITFTFNNAQNAKTGKLIINAKNSIWLDYIYGKFYEQFGTYYNKFAEKQKKVPASKNIQWTLDQGIPLSVYLETEKGWQFVDYFNVVGPLKARDMIMPIDLTEVKDKEVKIKLECGFMFWEVDYAAMDFSENIPVNVSHMTPSTAVDEKGNNVATLLTTSDDQYLFQPDIGNEATVKYTAVPSKTNYQQTAFLHSRGYYEYIRDYKGKPDFLYLNSFKKKGAFTKFSTKKYIEMMESINISTNKTKNHEN